MLRNPRARHHAVVAAADKALPPPPGDLEAQLYELLYTGRCKHQGVSYAYDLFQNPDHRAAMDAFAAARVQPAHVFAVLEVPADVVDVYRYLFFDVSQFRNRLELQSYCATYQGTDYGKELVRTAVIVGIEYLTWAFGKGSEELDNRAVVRRTMIDAFMRGLAHRGNAVTSPTAKAAQDWWRTAISNAQILEKLDPRGQKSAFEELHIALAPHDSTKSVDQSPVPVDELLT